jgi:SRSO17 transposase
MSDVIDRSDQTESSNLDIWDRAFDHLYQSLLPHFVRPETRYRVRRYLLGLLSLVERKNSWQLAEIMHESGPQGMQRLLNTAHWDADAVRDELRTYVMDQLGHPDGLLVLDETGFLKKGSYSVGVARQYSGTAGRIENQQIGVFLAYASPRGAALIDRALYLPEEWTQDLTRCQRSKVLESCTFASKPVLAQQMLESALAANVPARWVVADTVYSTTELRLWLEVHELWYVLAVPCNTLIWTEGQSVEVTELMAQVPADNWVRLSAGEGSQGARLYEWAWLQLPYLSTPGQTHWLLARRSITCPTERAYYHAYAPTSTTLHELVRVAGTRWVIETSFAQAKGEVGLDQYQVRTWEGWYRHVTLALLAYAYLVAIRATTPAASTDMIPLTVPEVRRLQHGLTETEYEREHRQQWSCWRRKHQATAKRCHIQRRQGRQDGAIGIGILPVPPPASLHAPVLLGIGALTEERWGQIAPLLPTRQARPGRRANAERHLLAGIMWVMATGAAWREVPADFGSWHTMYTRYHEWRKAGVWPQVVTILASGTGAMSAAA